MLEDWRPRAIADLRAQAVRCDQKAAHHDRLARETGDAGHMSMARDYADVAQQARALIAELETVGKSDVRLGKSEK